MAQLVHEFSSPLSSLWMRHAESPTDPGTAEAVERLRQLLCYGGAVLLNPPLDVAPAQVTPPLQQAAELLNRSRALRGPRLDHVDGDCTAFLPADERWTEALLCGLIEAATYGVAEAPLGASVRQSGGRACVTVTSSAEMSRDPRMLGERMAVTAAAGLAMMCGGRLMVSASRPRATLVLRATQGGGRW